MKTLWVTRDDFYVWFDCKEMQEALGIGKMPSDIEITMSDSEYKEFKEVSERYMYFQRRLEKLVKDKLNG